MSSLVDYLGKQVKVITVDGRLLLGTLEGFDKMTNLVLSAAKERVFSTDKPTEDSEMGLCIVRGNEVVTVAIYDEDEEAQIDYDTIRGEKLRDTKNALVD